ncbi:hypothetical protein BJ684DRAFT_14704 [Piptocephalis cylindrospora]|uniref:Nudix hydrolase domain-containing protein n=1 Tax=Piptocephalis cylindrospora TaxID=1907219 RepID=A0A4P9YAA8_9FUNG|nr:hypothetical protein BJ684DRAFT_14704 [Piptocephalis cylindrospora]|eukprot:RKP15000.1 hypothetical protein BJ684DRAFT_14704 [Piptocephalis cylindrospora]
MTFREIGTRITPDAPVHPIRTAASAIILRPLPGRGGTTEHTQGDVSEDYQVLLLERGTQGSFAQHHVFPGGVIDTSDEDKEWRKRLDKKSAEQVGGIRDKELSLRICAARETFEESTLLLAETLGNKKDMVGDTKVCHEVPEGVAWSGDAKDKESNWEKQEITTRLWLTPSQALHGTKSLKLAVPQYLILRLLQTLPRLRDAQVWFREAEGSLEEALPVDQRTTQGALVEGQGE